MNPKHNNPVAAKPDEARVDSRQRILVVEDDRDIRQVNAMVLMHSGYAVDMAEDGAAAWEALQANRYDLLVTDNNMPRLTGMDLLKEVRSAGMKLPVIMATGTVPTQELAQNPWLEPVAPLEKPYAADLLLETVKNVLHAAPRKNSQPRVAPKQQRRRNIFSGTIHRQLTS